MNVIKTICMFIDSPCIFARNSDVRIVSSDLSGIRIMTSAISEPVTVSLCGEYQISNISLALSVLRLIMVTGKLPIDENAVIEGLRNVTWSARFEIMKRNPYLIVDGAHNEDAWRKLAESLERYYPDRKLVFIIGVLADKEYHKMIDILKPLVKKAYTIESDNPRALPAKELTDEFYAMLNV